MGVFYVLLIIFALLGIILFIPVKMQIHLNANEKKILLKYAFFKKILYPTNKSEEKEGRTEDKKEKKVLKESKNKYDFEFLLKLFNAEKNILSVFLKKSISYIINHGIKISELNISGTFGTGDPAYTGILCGGVYSAIYNAIGVLEDKGLLKKHEININPDFEEMSLNIGVYAELRVRLINATVLLVIAIKYGLKFLKIYKRVRKEYNNG